MRNKKQEIIEFCEYMQKNFLNPCLKCEIQDICIENNPYKFSSESIENWSEKEMNDACNIIDKHYNKMGELLWNM